MESYFERLIKLIFGLESHQTTWLTDKFQEPFSRADVEIKWTVITQLHIILNSAVIKPSDEFSKVCFIYRKPHIGNLIIHTLSTVLQVPSPIFTFVSDIAKRMPSVSLITEMSKITIDYPHPCPFFYQHMHALRKGYPYTKREMTKTAEVFLKDMQQAAQQAEDYYKCLPPRSTSTTMAAAATSVNQIFNAELCAISASMIAGIPSNQSCKPSTSRKDETGVTLSTSTKTNPNHGLEISTTTTHDISSICTSDKGNTLSEYLSDTDESEQTQTSKKGHQDSMFENRQHQLSIGQFMKPLSLSSSSSSSSSYDQTDKNPIPSMLFSESSASNNENIENYQTTKTATQPPCKDVVSQIESLITTTFPTSLISKTMSTTRKRHNSEPSSTDTVAPKQKRPIDSSILYFHKLFLRLTSLQTAPKSLPDITNLTQSLMECLKQFQHDRIKITAVALKNNLLYPRICTLNFDEHLSVIKLYTSALLEFDALNERLMQGFKNDDKCKKIDLQEALIRKHHSFIYEVFDNYTQGTIQHLRDLCLHIVHALEQLPSRNDEYEESLKRKLQDLRGWHPPSEAMLETIQCFHQFTNKFTVAIVESMFDKKITSKVLATKIYYSMGADFDALALFCEGCNGGTN